MRQKEIWKLFLIIGISFILLSNKCSNTRTEPIKKVSYVYKNKTTTTLVMNVYNSSHRLIKTFTIKPGEKVKSNITKVEGAIPFYFDSDTGSIGNTVVIHLRSGKCIRYEKAQNDRIFNISKYDNYEKSFTKKEYTLTYTFDNSDINKAIDCK